MLRTLSVSIVLACAAAYAAKLTDYSADMVFLEGSQVVQSMRLHVSGQKSRVEGLKGGPIGSTVTIARRDWGVIWTLYPDKHVYTERRADAGTRGPAVDLSNFDLSALKTERLGHETVLGYPCTKMRVTAGRMPNGQALLVTAWVADALELPLRLETMGMIQENRNLRVGPQPASLFEIPAGYTKTSAPGRPPEAGKSIGQGASAAISSPDYRAARDEGSARLPHGTASALVAIAATAGRGDLRDVAAAATSGTASSPRWKLNTNYPGGDYRSMDMATSDPTACKAACDQERRCRAWTLVKPDAGGMGSCWLKDSIPPEVREDCCISGLKGAGGGQGGAQTAGQRFEHDVNRAGYDYRDFAPARASAVECAQACGRESRCRAWTWVKSDHEPPSGHCWLKNTVPEPGADECCVSGLK
jgi:hypothetical protein